MIFQSLLVVRMLTCSGGLKGTKLCGVLRTTRTLLRSTTGLLQSYWVTSVGGLQLAGANRLRLIHIGCSLPNLELLKMDLLDTQRTVPLGYRFGPPSLGPFDYSSLFHLGDDGILVFTSF